MTEHTLLPKPKSDIKIHKNHLYYKLLAENGGDCSYETFTRHVPFICQKRKCFRLANVPFLINS